VVVDELVLLLSVLVVDVDVVSVDVLVSVELSLPAPHAYAVPTPRPRHRTSELAPTAAFRARTLCMDDSFRWVHQHDARSRICVRSNTSGCGAPS
jgi:hypothetical protein